MDYELDFAERFLDNLDLATMPVGLVTFSMDLPASTSNFIQELLLHNYNVGHSEDDTGRADDLYERYQQFVNSQGDYEYNP